MYLKQLIYANIGSYYANSNRPMCFKPDDHENIWYGSMMAGVPCSSNISWKDLL